jgi:hypothetical protein
LPGARAWYRLALVRRLERVLVVLVALVLLLTVVVLLRRLLLSTGVW